MQKHNGANVLSQHDVNELFKRTKNNKNKKLNPPLELFYPNMQVGLAGLQTVKKLRFR